MGLPWPLNTDRSFTAEFPPDLPEVEIHIRESSPAHETAGGEFRQNPLADNDYTFARAPAGRVPDGRYCG